MAMTTLVTYTHQSVATVPVPGELFFALNDEVQLDVAVHKRSNSHPDRYYRYRVETLVTRNNNAND